MNNRSSFSAKTVIVAQSGAADYTTIGEAIKNVQPDTQILVQAGTYRESLTIDKPVEIIAESSTSVLVESFDASCISMQAKSALVRGLNLQNGFGEKQLKCDAVNISQGKLILEDCEITSNSSSCVFVRSAANPVIRRCRIYDSIGNGIRIKENAQATIEDCDIYNHTKPNIYISVDSNAIVSQCRIYDSKQNGIWITKNSQTTIEDCDIYSNAYPGIGVDKSNATIRRCRIYDGKGSGVWITNRSQATIAGCSIYSNSKSNVIIDIHSQTNISQCRIYDGKQNGIWIKENGLAIVKDCDIYSNAYPGIGVDKSNVTIRRCRIYDGKQNGIWIKPESQATLEDCDIYKNARSSVEINDSNPTIRRCRIHDGRSNGILIDKGLGTIEDCEIYGNGSLGVVIQNKSNPTFRRCRIERNPSPGMTIEKGCHPTFRRCTLRTNKPLYLDLATILALSIALPVVLAKGWAIPSLAAALGVSVPLFYRLSKKGFSQRFIYRIFFCTISFGISLGLALVFGLNLSLGLMLLIPFTLLILLFLIGMTWGLLFDKSDKKDFGELFIGVIFFSCILLIIASISISEYGLDYGIGLALLGTGLSLAAITIVPAWRQAKLMSKYGITSGSTK